MSHMRAAYQFASIHFAHVLGCLCPFFPSNSGLTKCSVHCLPFSYIFFFIQFNAISCARAFDCSFSNLIHSTYYLLFVSVSRWPLIFVFNLCIRFGIIITLCTQSRRLHSCMYVPNRAIIKMKLVFFSLIVVLVGNYAFWIIFVISFNFCLNFIIADWKIPNISTPPTPSHFLKEKKQPYNSLLLARICLHRNQRWSSSQR